MSWCQTYWSALITAVCLCVVAPPPSDIDLLTYFVFPLLSNISDFTVFRIRTLDGCSGVHSTWVNVLSYFPPACSVSSSAVRINKSRNSFLHPEQLFLERPYMVVRDTDILLLLLVSVRMRTHILSTSSAALRTAVMNVCFLFSPWLQDAFRWREVSRLVWCFRNIMFRMSVNESIFQGAARRSLTLINSHYMLLTFSFYLNY